VGWEQPALRSPVRDEVAAHTRGIEVEGPPLFDHVHRLVLEVRPDAQVAD